MGCGMSVEEKEGRQRNEEIENQLRKDRMSQKNEIKMLLLGMFFLLLQETTARFNYFVIVMLMMMFLAQALESLENQRFSNK